MCTYVWIRMRDWRDMKLLLYSVTDAPEKSEKMKNKNNEGKYAGYTFTLEAGKLQRN